MQATANLFETRLTFSRVRPGPKPLRPVVDGLEEGRTVCGAAVGSLFRKLRGGPGVYEGLWQLLRRTYDGLAAGSALPVTAQQILDVNRLVADLKPEGASR
jgi:hypothetical protein